MNQSNSISPIKLKNAPLLETIFEIRAESLTALDLGDYAFKAAEFHQAMKPAYAERANKPEAGLGLNIQHVHGVQHQFFGENRYPLFQTGPIVATTNSDGESYYWPDFEKSIRLLTAKIIEVDFFHTQANSERKFNLVWQYHNFFAINDSESISNFLKDSLSLEVRSPSLDGVGDLNGLELSSTTELGSLQLSFQRTILPTENTEPASSAGMLWRTTLFSHSLYLQPDPILAWANSAHDLCGGLFRTMTQPIYHQFT